MGALPDSIRSALRQAAEDWLASPNRPRPDPEISKVWDAVVAEWVKDPKCPLLIRKGGTRGCEVRHPSGRLIVCVDNSPAQWTLASAIAGDRPTVAELLKALESGEWPVAFALSKADANTLPRYRGILNRSPQAKALNDQQWKVCHIRDVGLRSRGSVDTLPIEGLIEHCRRLLSPSNMFVVPNSHAGFGELPEVIMVFSRG